MTYGVRVRDIRNSEVYLLNNVCVKCLHLLCTANLLRVVGKRAPKERGDALPEHLIALTPPRNRMNLDPARWGRCDGGAAYPGPF